MPVDDTEKTMITEDRVRTPRMERVNSSEASHDMAKSPSLKFADLHQEQDHWRIERIRVEKLLAEENASIQTMLEKASRQSRNAADWCSKKAAIESEHGQKRRRLVGELSVITQNLSAIKARIRQKAQREEIGSADRSLHRQEAMLNELMAIKILLSELVDLAKGKQASTADMQSAPSPRTTHTDRY